MGVLWKLLPIYVVLLAAQLIFSWFNYTFLFSKIKSGVYRLPYFYWVLAGSWVVFSAAYYIVAPKFKSGFLRSFFADGVFDSWWKFAVAAWMFNAPFYLAGTILVALSIKLSMENFGAVYTSIIIGQIITVLTTIFFMWYKMGELPNRNGWIALVLILIASIFAANSGKNI